MHPRRFIIISRKSPLALWQAQHVQQQLCAHYPGLSCEIITRTTEGDRTEMPLNAMGGKNLFIKELQQAVLNEEADMAIHSLKDMSVQDTPGLMLSAFLEREDPRDVLISKKNVAWSDLPPGAVVGTSSLRRQCLLWHLRPDLEVNVLRGNVGTRLARLEAERYDAIILAAAGLKRLGLADKITHYFDPETFIPAIAQGVIAVEVRAADTKIQELLAPLNHPQTELCARAERAVNRELKGDCFTPLGAYAFVREARLHLLGMLGSADGRAVFYTRAEGGLDEGEVMGHQIGKELSAQYLPNR